MSAIAGNTSTTAVLSAGETETHTIDSVGDADWFQVQLSAGLTYGFSASSSGGPGIGVPSPDLFFYDNLGNQLDSRTGSSSVKNTTIEATITGRYFVGVMETSNELGQYAVSFVATDNIRNDINTASSLAINGTVKSKIDVAYDRDWFGFNMTSGLTYGFETKADGVSGMPDADIDLHDALGNVIYHASNSTSSINTISYSATTTGHYFLEISDNGNTDVGAYATRFIATDTIQNNLSTANVLARGAQVSSAIDVSYDSDWFAITMTEGLSYSFTVAAAGVSGLPDGDLHLMDSNGNVIQHASNSTDTTNTLSVTAISSGTYFISVSDSGSSDYGNYVLRNVGVDTVLANENTGHVLSDGMRRSGLIDSSGDQDWYKFSAHQGTTYNFTITGDGSATELQWCRLILRDALGNQIKFVADQSGTISYTATADGPLFLDVQGYNSNYSGKFVLSVVSNTGTLNGSTSSDRIVGGTGNTVINAGLGNDWADGGLGNDMLFGSTGNDSLYGNAGSDLLYGGVGNDYLSGGTEGDKLDAGAGNDVLRGGAGSDQFIFRTTSNADSIVDFQDGADRIRIIGGPTSMSGLQLTQVGEDVRVSFGTVTILVDNITKAELTTADFLFA